MPNRPAVALDAAPSAEELLAAKAAGLTLVQYRAVRGAQAVGVPVKMRTDPSFAEMVASNRRFAALTGRRPVSLALPWSSLLPDNRKYASNTGVVWTTKEYRAAKAKAVDAIRDQLPPDWSPIAVPVAFRLVLIEPNRHRRRDLLNYQKLICDALKGLVYADDSLIDDHHWTRGTPDIDRPRAEITVTTIGAQP